MSVNGDRTKISDRCIFVNRENCKYGRAVNLARRKSDYERTFGTENVVFKVVAVTDHFEAVETEAGNRLGAFRIRGRTGRQNEWLQGIAAEDVERILADIIRDLGLFSTPLRSADLAAAAELSSLNASNFQHSPWLAPSTVITPKQLGDDGEEFTQKLLEARGYTVEKLPINTKTYDLRAHRNGKDFFVSVKVSRDREHVRLGARRSVLGLQAGNFVFAYLPVPGTQITTLATSKHSLIILPAEMAKADALAIHDAYWDQKQKDPNIFSVMVKGYGSHHREVWPKWLTFRDAWNLLL